jgi:tryptophan-rich sensory protein
MKRIHWIKLIGSILTCQLAGILGSIFTISAIPLWYVTLNKPFFSPPSWLFGPVWLTLYTLMGVSLYLVLVNKPSAENRQLKTRALALFVIHLVVNGVWSFLFFGLRSPLAGAIGIIALDVLAYYATFLFYRINKTAGYLLLPYLIWISFATILNISIVLLN